MVGQAGTAMHASAQDPPVISPPSRLSQLSPADPPGPFLLARSDQLQRHPQQHDRYPHDEQLQYELQQQPPPALHTSSTSASTATQPACLLWARDLQTLLNDDEGCGLFEHYLHEENCDESDLMFVYACNGLRVQENQQDRDKQARAIYKRYVKTNVVQLSDEVKDVLAEKIRNRGQPLEPDIFDVARKEVENYIMRTTFARFIQSDQYIDYVQRYSNEQDSSVGAPLIPDARDDGDADGDYLELNDLDYENDHSGLVSIPSDSEDDPDSLHFVNHTSSLSTIVPLHNTNNIIINNNNSKHTNHNNNNNHINNNNNNNNSDIVSEHKNDAYLLSQQQQQQGCLMPTVPEHEEDSETSTIVPPPPTTLARKPTSLQPARAHGPTTMASSDEASPPPPPLPPQSKIVQRQKRQAQLGMSYGETVLRQGGQRPPPNPYHVKSSPFVPPTAYNSDMQSMSSGGNGNYDPEASDCDTVIAARRKEQLPRGPHQHDIERRRQGRPWPPAGELIRDPMGDKVIPRTMFPNMQESHLAERKPNEFFQKLCQKLAPIAREQELREQGRMPPAVLEEEQHSQAILDDHVERVFKTPPARTPRSPSPGPGPSRGGQRSSGPGKSANQQVSRGSTRRIPLKDIPESLLHGLMTSSAAASGTVPRIQPRGKGASLTLPKSLLPDSACDESGGIGYDPQDNVRDWMNLTGAEGAAANVKSKASKASICSGSNRSSCRSHHENASNAATDKKKKGVLSTSSIPVGNEIAIIYTYAGESVPYFIKLAQRQVRLREFKIQLIKKGNFRYFFKRPMDEFNAHGVFEEIKDDNQILPCWEGKIVAQIGLMQPSHMPEESE